jgi:hypothetical protein
VSAPDAVLPRERDKPMDKDEHERCWLYERCWHCQKPAIFDPEENTPEDVYVFHEACIDDYVRKQYRVLIVHV